MLRKTQLQPTVCRKKLSKPSSLRFGTFPFIVSPFCPGGHFPISHPFLSILLSFSFLFDRSVRFREIQPSMHAFRDSIPPSCFTHAAFLRPTFSTVHTHRLTRLLLPYKASLKEEEEEGQEVRPSLLQGKGQSDQSFFFSFFSSIAARTIAGSRGGKGEKNSGPAYAHAAGTRTEVGAVKGSEKNQNSISNFLFPSLFYS